MSQGDVSCAELSSAEKIWLLAGELLRDEGVEEVNARHLASLLGQTLACVAIHETINPLDKRVLSHVLDCADAAASETHEFFIDRVRSAQ